MIKLFKIYKALTIFLLFLLISSSASAADFEIRGDKFYLKGQPFFINAVGYAPWRPGQWPGTDSVSIGVIDYDFNLIKKAGFNTIRTWEALEPEELKLAQKHGLYVIQGIWLDPKHDLSDWQWQNFQLHKVKDIVQYTKPFSNVLFYLILTEPTTQAIVYAGKEETNAFFKRIKESVQLVDKRPVSMDSWVPVGFMDYSIWDIVTFNIFMFIPESINKVIEFKNQVRFFKDNCAKNKPLFIGETGGFSISPTSKNGIGYGGNTEQQQAAGDIASIEQAIKSGAAGVTTVSWIDTWHYPKDPSTHDNEPWKWDGLLAFEKKDDPWGRLRFVYFEMEKFFQQKLPQIVDQFYKHPNVFYSKASIKITAVNDIFDLKDQVSVKISATLDGKPLANKKVKYGFFIEYHWQETFGEVMTDAKGEAKAICPLPLEPDSGYVLAFASFEEQSKQAYDLKYLKIRFLKDRGKYFYVYKDHFHPLNHFIPSGWTGEYKQLSFEDDYKEAYSGDSSIRITYRPSANKSEFSGLYWLNPLNNWGMIKGGYNLTGKTSLTFWARGEKGGERISQFIAGAVQVNQYQDSSTTWLSGVTLTKDWKQYKIDLTGKDLSSISGGFALIILAANNPNGCVFYLDDIKYE